MADEERFRLRMPRFQRWQLFAALAVILAVGLAVPIVLGLKALNETARTAYGLFVSSRSEFDKIFL